MGSDLGSVMSSVTPDHIKGVHKNKHNGMKKNYYLVAEYHERTKLERSQGVGHRALKLGIETDIYHLPENKGKNRE